MRLSARLQRLSKPLTSPWGLLTIGVFIVALLVWFAGPFVVVAGYQPLAPAAVRLAILLVLVLAWSIAGLFVRTSRAREDQALLAALRRQQDEERTAAEQAEAALAAEFSTFRASAREAVHFARKGSGRLLARDRYRTPWYLVLGVQGAGKTSFVNHSGLMLAHESNSSELAGFHLADQAVLIEINGSVLKQEDEPLASLWPRMLDHLRRLRPQQPVNGIIVTLGADSLAAMQQEAAIEFAARLRQRIDEAVERLRSRVPIYIVVSKLDLLIGFEEFFDTLSSEERSSVLGFPLLSAQEPSGQPMAERFKQGFGETVDKLSSHLLQRLQEEPDEHRRRRAFEFPTHFATMQAALETLVSHVASQRRYGDQPFVRGLFFTSAVQAETSIDLLARPLSESFGQHPDRLALRVDDATPRRRPYFLRNLFGEVILREAVSSGLSRPAAIFAKAQGLTANAAIAIATLALLSFWWLSFSEGGAYVARLENDARVAKTNLAAATERSRAPSGFEPVLATLDSLKELADEAPRSSTLGLYGTSGVGEASRSAYDRALQGMMFPFVWRYLQTRMDDPQTSAFLRFQQLKLYSMLSSDHALDGQTAGLLGPDFSDMWLTNASTAQRNAVSDHLVSLAAASIPRQGSDDGLVDRARGRITDYTLARLAYDMLLAQPSIRQLPPWRPVDHMGMAGPQAIARVSGASLWNGIPGAFTRSGFFDAVLAAAGPVSEQIASDFWVMGLAQPAAKREAQRIRDGLLDLYRVDYIRQWDSFLSDLTVVDSTNAGDVARIQAIITGAPSPIKQLMTATAAETRLARTANLTSALPDAATAQIERVAATARTPQRVVNVEEAVADHFMPFVEAVSADEGQQSQIDAMLAALEPLYRQINHVATGGDVLELGVQPQTILSQLSEQAGSLPPALQPLFRRILAQAAAVTGGSSRERLAQIWNTTVAPSCKATTADRYPFSPTSNSDASLSDFADLFGPKGLIASFRNDYLKPFIDTTAKPWRWRAGQQVGLNLDEGVLSAFERADEITLAYFGDAAQPAVSFIVEPARLDPKARAMQLDIGGPVLVYSHGPAMTAAFRWPPERTDADAMLSLTPEFDGERNILRRQGPWALFRLFDAGRVLRPDPTDVVPFGFTIGSRTVVLNVTAPATRNPFARNILADFQCPVL